MAKRLVILKKKKEIKKKHFYRTVDAIDLLIAQYTTCILDNLNVIILLCNY